MRTVDPSITSVRSLSRLAYLIIRDKIVTTELAPGSLVDETMLSATIGLGRTPVREALTLLSNERFVYTIPRRGRVISDINVADLRLIYESRSSCEEVAVRLAAERCTEEDKAQARVLIAELDALDPAAIDEPTLIQLDQRVHEHIYRCVHNKFLLDTLNWYLYLALRLWYFQMDTMRQRRTEHTHHQGITELKDLLTAIITGDPDRAATLAAAHLDRSQREIFAPLHH